jgi:hypothetical protein
MPHRTTSTKHHHAKEQQTRCEASNTLKGEYCENPGTQRTMDGLLLLCEQHARQFGLEERIACWEAILLHIELWSKIARTRGREDIVHLLQLERAEAIAAHKRAYEDLEQLAKKEGHQLKRREIYGFMS